MIKKKRTSFANTSTEHYKAYKTNRGWVYAMIIGLSTTAALIGVGAQAKADTETPTPAKTAAVSKSVATTNESTATLKSAASNAAQTDAKTTSSAPATSSNASSTTEAGNTTGAPTSTNSSNSATTTTADNKTATSTATPNSDASSTTEVNNQTAVFTDPTTAEASDSSATSSTTSADTDASTDSSSDSNSDGVTSENTTTVSNADDLATAKTAAAEKYTATGQAQKVVAVSATTAGQLAQGTNGTATWDITDDGVLTLHAGTLSASTPSWKPYLDNITSITADAGTKLTGSTWQYFGEMHNVTSIDLHNLDVSGVTSMSGMFQNDYKLQSIDLSGWNTSRVTNMQYMFWNNQSSVLTSLDVSSFDTSKVTTMWNMFSGLSSLKSLDLSNFDTSKVTNFNSMFRQDSSLSQLNISSFNTGNGTDFSSMFTGTSSLWNLDVTGFDTSKATTMNDMFDYTVADVDVSGFNTSNVTDMGYMFMNAKGVIDLDLNNFDTSKVTNMSNMFAGAVWLQSLDISSWDMSNVINNSAMFSLDTSLWKLTIGPKVNIENSGLLQAPGRNTYIPDDSGKTNPVTQWQLVAGGTPHAPEGALGFPVNQDSVQTYVWAQKIANAVDFIDAQTGLPLPASTDTGKLYVIGFYGANIQTGADTDLLIYFPQSYHYATGDELNGHVQPAENTPVGSPDTHIVFYVAATHTLPDDTETTTTLTVHYVDQNGNTLQPDTTQSGKVGTTFTVDAPTIDRYTLADSSQQQVNGTFAGNTMALTLVYKQIGSDTTVPVDQTTTTLTVHYVDQNGNTLQPDTTQSGKIGTTFTVDAPTIDRYTLADSSQQQVNGTFAGNAMTLTLIYKQNGSDTTVPVVQTATKLTVHYVDQDGNTLRPDTTQSGKVGTAFTVNAPAIAKYTLANSSQQKVAGTYAGNTMTLTLVYKQNGSDTTVPVDQTTTKLTVHYVDQDGNTLRPDTTQSGKVGTAFTVNAPAIAKYTLADSSQQQINGTFAGNTMTLTLVYKSTGSGTNPGGSGETVTPPSNPGTTPENPGKPTKPSTVPDTADNLPDTDNDAKKSSTPDGLTNTATTNTANKTLANETNAQQVSTQPRSSSALPQTGDASGLTATIIGLVGLVLASLGLADRRRKQH